MARPRARALSPLALGLVFLGCATERPALTASRETVSDAAPEGKGSAPRGRDRSGFASPSNGNSAEEAALEATYGGRRALGVLSGKATYYGHALVGHRTASGERYDPRRYTAAHRTLAFGTVVRVIRADARGAVYVRITDRGPFGDGRRIIDLSLAAAERLGIIRSGVAQVRVEILEYGRRSPRR